MPADVSRATSASPSSLGVSRRTVVRGAAVTAWTVPAVTLVTAAPAFAVSATLNLTLVSANYTNHTNAGTVDPTELKVAATVGNSGTHPTVNAGVTLTIPSGLYDMAPVATAPGFGTAVVTGSLAAGWTLAFTAETQIAPGAANARTFNAVVKFQGAATAPYRLHAGTGFTLPLVANAANATPGSSSTVVAATPNGTFARSGTASIVMNSASGDRARCTLQNFWNAGRSSIGQITVVVMIPKGSGGSVWANIPESQPAGTDGKWTFVGSSSADNQWKYTFRSNLTAYGPATLAGTNGPSANNSFYTEVIRVYKFGNVNANLPSGRSFTVSAPRAETITWTV